jgi:VWFA-related protein
MSKISINLAVCLILVIVSVAPISSEPAAGSGYKGYRLIDALEDLQARGLRVLYSSDLVDPQMMVEREPTASSLHRTLNQLLGPHGLGSQVGPRGSLLVVKRPPPPIWVTVQSPTPSDATFGEIDFAADVVSSEEIDRVDFLVNGEVVTTFRKPPFHIRIDVGEENIDRNFTVRAIGAWGASGTGSTSTRRLEFLDEFDVSLRQVFVTVVRPAGEARTELRREDFKIFDNRTKQKLVTFERGDVPITAVLLLDASQSMQGRNLEAALDGSKAFLGRLNTLDEAMVMLFSDRSLAATHFSNERRPLLAQLANTRATGGTALNDHLYASLKLLDQRQGRRVTVLLSDGADVVSTLRMEDVLWKVRRTDALIYWIRLHNQDEDSFASAWRNFDANALEWEGLKRAVEESGGRSETLSGIEDIDQAFEGIMKELREQYVLGYYPEAPDNDRGYHDIKIEVARPGIKLRYREGYVSE